MSSGELLGPCNQDDPATGATDGGGLLALLNLGLLDGNRLSRREPVTIDVRGLEPFREQPQRLELALQHQRAERLQPHPANVDAGGAGRDQNGAPPADDREARMSGSRKSTTDFRYRLFSTLN